MAISVTRTRSARIYHTQQVHYLNRRFNFNDHDPAASGAAKIHLGVLPAHCFPLEVYVRINSSFTGANLIVGTSAAGSSAAVVSTADVAAGSTGSTIVDRYLGTYSTVDVPLYIQTKATGETIGQADVWLAYLPVSAGAT
jgi:hypothetical protein